MKTLKRCRHILHVLKTADPKLRKAILHNAPKHLIHALSEICYNTLQGNVHMSKQTKAKLHPYKNVIRELANSRVKHGRKRRILQQKGGFLGVLLGSLLSGLVGSLFHKS